MKPLDIFRILDLLAIDCFIDITYWYDTVKKCSYENISVNTESLSVFPFNVRGLE